MCLYFLQCALESHNCDCIPQCEFVSYFTYYLTIFFYSEAAGLHTLAPCVASLVEQI